MISNINFSVGILNNTLKNIFLHYVQCTYIIQFFHKKKILFNIQKKKQQTSVFYLIKIFYFMCVRTIGKNPISIQMIYILHKNMIKDMCCALPLKYPYLFKFAKIIWEIVLFFFIYYIFQDTFLLVDIYYYRYQQSLIYKYHVGKK